jgi:hypothetical protein
MLSGALADAVLLLHFLFILFAIFGGLLILSNKKMAWLHVPVVLWSSIVNLAGWTCPLTPIENYFRSAAGLAGYQGGFVEHYIGQLVYPAGMPRKLELIAAVSIIAWNFVVYAFLVWKLRRRTLQ